jgi:PAS domain S-box-containing protein
VVEDIPSFRKYTGQTYEEVKGWGWTTALHPDDVERTKLLWKKALEKNSAYEAEYRLRRYDGVYRYFMARGIPVSNENGEAREWVGTCIDITSHRELEKELAESLRAAQLRQSEVTALLKASKAVLQHREFKNSAREIFDSCKELLGATAGYVALLANSGKENEVLFLDSGGLPCTVDPALPMPIRGLRQEAYAGAEVVYNNSFLRSEYAKLMPIGHVKLENVLFAPLISNKQAVGVIGLANKPGGFNNHDAEVAFAFGAIASVALLNSQVLEGLEMEIEQRTRQLRDSERLATVGATAAMVGHDIRNPLQAIVGDVYLLRSDLASMPASEETENMKESIESIETNLEYVNKIIRDLQDFTKPIKPNAQDVNVESLCEDVMLKNGVSDNIDGSCQVEEKAKNLVTDPDVLKRILSNLVNNAIQAMPEGGKLTLHAYLEAGDTVICVQDSGVGISEEVKSKLFTPLFTTKPKGQGFGLAVVKRMTKALGGTVTYESEVGKGTKFILRLPPSKK